jgi:hypothetical protein
MQRPGMGSRLRLLAPPWFHRGWGEDPGNLHSYFKAQSRRYSDDSDPSVERAKPQNYSRGSAPGRISAKMFGIVLALVGVGD